MRAFTALILLASAGGAAAQATTLVARDGTAFQVETHRVIVPENRQGGDGRITLSVVRIRRPGAAPGDVPHLFLAGGPGASGVALARNLAVGGGARLFELLGGDLIGIDQRGTGASTPNLEVPGAYDLPLAKPGGEATWLPIMAEASAEAASRFRARGIDLAAYNTRESADDIVAVLESLELEQVVLWGRSYGSHLALATMRRHPERVEAAVLVSPEGPDHTLKSPAATDRVLDRLSVLLAADPAWSARVPDLRALVVSVLDRLRAQPVEVGTRHPLTGAPVTVALGAFDIQWLTMQALADPRKRAGLPGAFLQMADGDFRAVAPIAVSYRSRLGTESAMKQMMDLSSGASPTRRRQVTEEARSAVLGDAVNFPGLSLGQAWGNPDLGEAFRRPVRSDIPTLVLAGDLDPRTPLENAVAIVGHLSRGELVVLRNAAHRFDLFGHPEIREALRRFLAGQSLQVEEIRLPAPRFAPPAGS